MKKYLNKIRMAAFVTLLTAATFFPSVAVSAAPSAQSSSAASQSEASAAQSQQDDPSDTETNYQQSDTETPQASDTAEPDENSEQQSSAAAETSGGELQHYFFDNNLVNAGYDTGYKEKNDITKDDPHFGWNLGKFNITGYTRITNEDTDTPVFLKTVGDKVALWFKLDQDITKLNGDENLKISDDSNGYDEYFGIKETNFKEGTLIIKHSDYQNKNQKPVVYTDYLNSKLNKGADTKVELFEEGDYEVALDYEIEKNSKVLLIPKTEYFNYRIFFKFSVRNGNCMVYPFDTKTNEELTNTSITPNGFRLDLAKSRYLDINIKKEVLKEGADGLAEDIRFNGPAKDGAQYTSEGIYTITVSNRYTDQQTEKKIYVGNNNLLKAHITTGLSISEIKKKIEAGAEINDDGTIVTVVKRSQITPEKVAVDEKAIAANSTPKTESMSKNEKAAKAADIAQNNTFIFVAAGAFAGIVIIGTIVVLINRKTKKNSDSRSRLKNMETDK